jgi:hypothetical protein
MEVVKTLSLGWLVSFGTIAYLWLALYRRLPSGTAVAARVFAGYTVYSVFWWVGVTACFVITFPIIK